uniref:Disease resistance protein RGA1 n=1 Tax=Elaeis guineensis var. tenera TaxID=51953 RepID=A0A6I9R8J1_ELAGV|nr:putative disease resistance protein RGA1 [Elaeis guineensis]
MDGATIASDIVTAVIGKLGSRISEEFGLLRRFKDDLEDLRCILTAIRAVLQDAEERCAKDEALRDWLKKLKDVAYDVDDLLDEFDTDSAQRQKVKMVCRFFSHSNPLIFGCMMVHKVKSLRARLDKIAEEKNKFHFAPNRWPEIEKRDTFSMVDESRIVGRDGDKEKIMKLLLDTTTEEDISVIPIVGMGGLGKTTLAQLVFNDGRTNSEVFDLRIWICVSGDFNLKTIVQPILDATKEKCDINNLESIASCLARVFTERRYLLVLDDCWNENQDEWEKLKLLLKDGKRGSKIIVTTRSKKVAMIMKTVEPFHLQGLSIDDCWELFKWKAFEKGEEEKYPNLVIIGMEIVKKCGGVPLAANALGSLMRFKRTEDSWLAVKNSEIWRLEQEDKILPSLRLSYTQMPSPLKQCFAYCSIFPKHYEIDKEKLIQQWIALGFIRSREGQSWPLEDKGNEYFNHLLWMSFLQEVEEDKSLGRTKYRMHHLVHDLAQSVAGDEVVVLDEWTTGISEACRYASLTGCKGRPEIPNVVLNKVHALHLRRSPLYKKPLSSTKHLRALDLHGNQMKELPNSIKKMKLLRYLDVSSTWIETLPESMSNLHNLQCLYLSQCSSLQMLPEFIGRFDNLQVLDLTACKFQTLPNSIGRLQNLQTLNLSLCPYLKFLPHSFGNLESLQTLNLEGCYYLSMLPDSICSLKNLQSLNLSQCRFLERLPGSLGRLSNLLELNLSACSQLQALPESIGSIGRLQTLNLSHCSDLERLPESIGRLQNLQVLNLSQYIDIRILPESMSNLVNLQDLNLSLNIILETLPEFVSSLQNLRTLNLFQCWGLQQLPESLTNLMKLEILNLVGCENLRELPDGLSNMTNLRHLRNDKCWSLRGMPRGIGCLTNLQSLPLFIMNEKGSSRYSRIAELEHLNLLSGDLQIQCPIKAKNLVADAQKAKLKDKKNLRSLTLSWKSHRSEEVEALLESLPPPQNLEVLNIDGYMGTKFSSWMTNKIESWLPNLVRLTLSNIHICDCLPSLGQLPALQFLELRYMSGLRYMDTESYVSDPRLIPYPSLKELHFENIPDLEEWPTAVMVDNGGGRHEVFMFTSLKTLTASGCPKLKPKPCLPTSIVDLWVCNNSEMLSLRWQMGPSSSASSSSLLRRLWVKNCGISSDGWKGLQYHNRLEDLTIESCDELISLPESMQVFISLKSLKILACTNLAKLPEWLGDLTSLETLEISRCPNLTALPQGIECLTVLKELIISCCSPLLRTDGLNISHVPNIFID